MEKLFIEGDAERPRVEFDPETGILEISESSYPEYTKEIYAPIVQWLEEYLSEKGKTVIFNFRMDYFNTSTSSRFQKMIDMLEDYYLNKEGKVVINWYYEEDDIDMYEAGQDYAKDVTLEFNLIPFSL
ncbi:MAG TPA: hypothetical protein DCM08_05220 [Microscillaceae bacterium]|nr:hypothetical protein [Microscillaceae bacterium]